MADTRRTIVHSETLPQPLARQVRWFNAPEGDPGAGAPPTPPNITPPATPTPQPATGDDNGRGSKAAVLADLARERDARQALETQFQALTEALTKGLGLGKDEAPDPARLAQDLADRDRKIKEYEARETIRATAPANVDVDALLDSTRFLSTLADMDLSNRDALASHIKTFVTDNPRFTTGPPGVRDAAHNGHTPPQDPTATAAPGTARMAAGFDQKINNPRP